jgi:hemerythrin-like metal-binding protein
MSLLVWENRFLFGITEIDTQHQKIFDIINQLSDSAALSDHTQTASILYQLSEYANYHFAAEEKYFQQFNYEHKDQHVLMHQAYAKHITEFILGYGQHKLGLIQEILDYLKIWWVDHIQGADRGYVELFRQQGLN